MTIDVEAAPSMNDSLAERASRRLAALGLKLCTLRPVEARLHRVFYDVLARRIKADEGWHFMNYGFHSQHFVDQPLSLRPEDAVDRCGIQLYHYLLTSLSIAGARVLEVGCGRCGGADYVQRYLCPRLTVALDRCSRTLGIAASRGRSGEISLIAADAQQLPFVDGSFDVVINIESSHAYPRMESFLQEVVRVLAPGGFLAFADLRWAGHQVESGSVSGLDRLKEQLEHCGLRMVQAADISSGVLCARALEEVRSGALIRTYAPWGLRRAFTELAALPGTMLNRSLREATLVYWSALLQKPRSCGAAPSAGVSLMTRQNLDR